MHQPACKNSRLDNKPVTFSAEHFDAFNALEYAQQSQLLTSISLELFATACCLITKVNYLQALLTCLDAEQSQLVLSAIHKKQLLKPSPLFITRVQKMLISLHTLFSDVICHVGEFTVTANIDMTEYDSDLAALEAFAVIDNKMHDTKCETKKLFCEQTLIESIKKVSKKDEAKYQAVLAAGALKRLSPH